MKRIGKVIGYVLLAVLPGLLLTACTFIVSQVVQVVLTFKYVGSGAAADQEAIVAYLTDYLQGDSLLKIVIAGQLIALAIAVLIIFKGMKAGAIFGKPLNAVKKLNGLAILLTGIGLELTISFVMLIISLAAPGALDSYNEMIGNSGLAGFTVISTLATVVVAPMCEEVIFRGLTVKILEKTGLNFWIVNTLQAVLFGVYHLNLVQGLYAFVLGFVLGLIAKKCNTIWASILAHAVFNFSGTYIIGFLGQYIEESVASVALPLAAAVLVAVLGIYLLFTKVEEEN